MWDTVRNWTSASQDESPHQNPTTLAPWKPENTSYGILLWQPGLTKAWPYNQSFGDTEHAGEGSHEAGWAGDGDQSTPRLLSGGASLSPSCFLGWQTGHFLRQPGSEEAAIFFFLGQMCTLAPTV